MAAMIINKKEIESLDKIQNDIYRGILELPKRTARVYLIGEMGSSTFKGRDREFKLSLLKHIMDNTVKLKEMIENE